MVCKVHNSRSDFDFASKDNRDKYKKYTNKSMTWYVGNGIFFKLRKNKINHASTSYEKMHMNSMLNTTQYKWNKYIT